MKIFLLKILFHSVGKFHRFNDYVSGLVNRKVRLAVERSLVTPGGVFRKHLSYLVNIECRLSGFERRVP